MSTTEIPNMDSVLFKIRRIKDLLFFVNEPLFKPDKEAKVDFNNVLAYNLESNLVFFTLRITFHYGDDELKSPLMEAQIQNIFEVLDLKRFMQGDKLSLPANFLISMVSMSVTHSRALLAKNSSGTAYQDTFIPIVNAETMTKVFFPEAFDEPKVVDQLDELKEPFKKKQRLRASKSVSKNTY